ncbi:phosphotransferase [Epibacterium ulvae]|uniref:phosphotransferase n=1 Tax=Epibacterium ulvae TaxID=1156985 RepID=UPI0024920992|nr:phosphotransferase [Epibacterium ulvae]
MEHVLKTFYPSFQASLSVELPEFDLLNCGVERLTGGRSNELWRLGEIVVKLYNIGHQNPLFANEPNHEASILQELSGRKIAPDFLAKGIYDERPWIVYRHVSGSRWARDVGQVAQLLSAVHQLTGSVPNGVNGSQALLCQTETILRCCAGKSALWRERPNHSVAPLNTVSLIHGDPVPGNFVCGDHGLRLIDWQCPKMGDPSEDIALFLSPAMQFLYRGAPLTAAEEQEFLETYPDHQIIARYLDIKPWYHWRMAAYCEWRGDLEARDLEREALAECRT